MSKPTVAVFGVSGRIGPHILKALVSAEYSQYYQMPIRALTGKGGYQSNDTVRYYQVDTAETDSLLNALDKVDILINTASSRADHGVLVDLAVTCGVQVYFPSDFDMDFEKTPWHHAFQNKLRALTYARGQHWKSIDIKCGFFGDYMLTHSFNFGLDVKGGVYTRYGDGSSPVAITFLDDVGRAIASVAHRALHENDVPEKLLIQGDIISRDEYVELFEKCTGKSFERVQVDTDAALRVADAINDHGTITRPEKFKVIQAMLCLKPETAAYTFGKNHNDVVNRNEFEWTRFKPAAEKLWSSADFAQEEGL